MSVLDRKKAECVKDALKALAGDPPSAGVWDALPTLSRLSETGHDIAIDFSATELIGAPVVIAKERNGRIESAAGVLDCLTARQKDVARSMARGLSNKQIARTLSISIPTTKDHVHAVLKKLELTSRNQLAALLYDPDLNG